MIKKYVNIFRGKNYFSTIDIYGMLFCVNYNQLDIKYNYLKKIIFSVYVFTFTFFVLNITTYI